MIGIIAFDSIFIRTIKAITKENINSSLLFSNLKAIEDRTANINPASNFENDKYIAMARVKIPNQKIIQFYLNHLEFHQHLNYFLYNVF